MGIVKTAIYICCKQPNYELNIDRSFSLSIKTEPFDTLQMFVVMIEGRQYICKKHETDANKIVVSGFFNLYRIKGNRKGINKKRHIVKGKTIVFKEVTFTVKQCQTFLKYKETITQEIKSRQ